jgi:hypothetical protein
LEIFLDKYEQKTQLATWQLLRITSIGASNLKRFQHVCWWLPPLLGLVRKYGFGRLKYLANQEN